MTDALERGIPMRQVEGTFTMDTGADWILKRVTGDVLLKLDLSASSEERARADANQSAQGASCETQQDRERQVERGKNLSNRADADLASFDGLVPQPDGQLSGRRT